MLSRYQSWLFFFHLICTSLWLVNWVNSKAKPHFALRIITYISQISKSKFENHSPQFSYISRHDVSVPRRLNKDNIAQQMPICEFKKRKTWRKRAHFEENCDKGRNWSCSTIWSANYHEGSTMGLHSQTSKQGFTRRSRYFYYVRIAIHEFLSSERTVDSDVYWEELDELNAVIHQKRLSSQQCQVKDLFADTAEVTETCMGDSALHSTFWFLLISARLSIQKIFKSTLTCFPPI